MSNPERNQKAGDGFVTTLGTNDEKYYRTGARLLQDTMNRVNESKNMNEQRFFNFFNTHKILASLAIVK